MYTTTRAAAIAAAATVTALALATPARAVALDPSAYGVAAAGSAALAPTPSVSWTSGPPLAGSSPGVLLPALSTGALRVAAGEGYAAVTVAGLNGYGVSVTRLDAACSHGNTALNITGTAAGVPLPASGRVALPGGGYLLIGTRVGNTDGTTTLTGLTLQSGGETVTAAVVRC